MSIERQLLFFFSALGAFNGIFLSFYFLFSTKKKQVSNYFLSGLLLVLSIRIIKSVFMYFNPGLSQVFIQIGISACALIGPLLYLYIKNFYSKDNNKNWLFHILPVTLVIIFLGYKYPYWEHRAIWAKYIIKGVYLQWFLYVIAAGFLLKPILKKLFKKKETLQQIELWVLSIYIGVFCILVGYNVGAYTSYIVGAISSSFIFYLILLFWFFKRKKGSLFFEEKIKYADKKIDTTEVFSLQNSLDSLISNEELFKDANLKINDVAKQLQLSPHYLSQFLNDNLEKSFSSFINEYRIENAKKLLTLNKSYTIEAIGYESGFNSKSTFFSTFKKLTGFTPSKYRKINT